uniref:Uncharacterized protein n=1 Tax=Leishmania guyanensis TaxID=5670 RepID=A0A1E1J2Z3_LEIGU|nr:Hypothetical protein BN36_3154340 [Leishmania guyanensis]
MSSRAFLSPSLSLSFLPRQKCTTSRSSRTLHVPFLLALRPSTTGHSPPGTHTHTHTLPPLVPLPLCPPRSPISSSLFFLFVCFF